MRDGSLHLKEDQKVKEEGKEVGEVTECRLLSQCSADSCLWVKMNGCA